MQASAETVIRDIIRTGDSLGYDRMIKDLKSRAVFYHLSSLRCGMLCWYPFIGSWNCLEIGAGFGSLTGVLIQNMRTVDAVEQNAERRESLAERYENGQAAVYERMPEGKKYDCIILMDSFTKEADAEGLLTACRERLSDEGVLLLGYENRLGMNNAAGENSGTLFTRDEIDEMASRAGFKELFYYYILPDVFFPQAVYSDRELPGESSDRFFFHRAFSPGDADEEAAYKKMLKEGLLEKQADYYLAELRKKPYVGPRVIKAYLSCDRGRERSSVIRFFENGIVEKLPVYPEGWKSLLEMCRNLEELEQRGIRIVRHRIGDTCVRMPFVEKPSLLWYLKEHPEKTEECFDLLYRNILRSSELSDDERILKKGYIDMIPFNCFYDDGELVYYDQEFTEKNCPVSYIMFRSVFYTYLHVPGLNRVIPQEMLKEKYGLKDIWNRCFEKEDRFLKENRKQDLYHLVWGR